MGVVFLGVDVVRDRVGESALFMAARSPVERGAAGDSRATGTSDEYTISTGGPGLHLGLGECSIVGDNDSTDCWAGLSSAQFRVSLVFPGPKTSSLGAEKSPSLTASMLSPSFRWPSGSVYAVMSRWSPRGTVFKADSLALTLPPCFVGPASLCRISVAWVRLLWSLGSGGLAHLPLVPSWLSW